ncbi:unnamed protein product, partial [Rotaria magnacalcarata]
FSAEDDTHECIPKKTTYDSGFVDTSDENNSSIMVKQGGLNYPNELHRMYPPQE